MKENPVDDKPLLTGAETGTCVARENDVEEEVVVELVGTD